MVELADHEDRVRSDAFAQHGAAVVLESPYSSIADVGQAHYPIFPVRPLLRDRFDSLSRIADIGAPLLVIHGETDQVVPFSLGERLFADAVEPKSFMAVPDVGHNELDIAPVRARVEAFIDALR